MLYANFQGDFAVGRQATNSFHDTVKIFKSGLQWFCKRKFTKNTFCTPGKTVLNHAFHSLYWSHRYSGVSWKSTKYVLSPEEFQSKNDHKIKKKKDTSKPHAGSLFSTNEPLEQKQSYLGNSVLWNLSWLLTVLQYLTNVTNQTNGISMGAKTGSTF